MNALPGAWPSPATATSIAKCVLRAAKRLFLPPLPVAALFLALPRAQSVTITETTYEDRPQFQVITKAATYSYDKAGGGFSRLIDRDGKDWISFHKNPLKENPASAAAGYRGIPNLLFGKDNPDAGAGHPGFDQCESTRVSDTSIRTVSKSGRWAWTWQFTEEHATLTIEKADANQTYWFLYEGTVGGRWSPKSHYWGADTGGPRRETPDNKRQLFEKWQWVYFGDVQSPRVLLAMQLEKDDAPDTLWYMGNSSSGLNSTDGMVVFGFGRGPSTSKHLRGAGKKFVLGFIEADAKDAAGHARIAKTAETWSSNR